MQAAGLVLLLVVVVVVAREYYVRVLHVNINTCRGIRVLPTSANKQSTVCRAAALTLCDETDLLCLLKKTRDVVLLQVLEYVQIGLSE